jgi:hypothetical protein
MLYIYNRNNFLIIYPVIFYYLLINIQNNVTLGSITTSV